MLGHVGFPSEGSTRVTRSVLIQRGLKLVLKAAFWCCQLVLLPSSSAEGSACEC